MRCRWIVCCCLTLIPTAGWLVADEPAPANQEQFIRIARDQDEVPTALEAAIVRYVPAGGEGETHVDLISAIHVAEPDFFAGLNRRFQAYDAVLYELVAPKGTRIPRGGVRQQSAVSLLQGGMTQALGLSFQLDEIDYTRPNLVHADMTPAEFAQSMQDRGESLGKMFFRAVGQAMARQSGDVAGATDVRLLTAMFSDHREHELKLILAEEFANLGGVMVVYEGPNGSTLVTERNKKALDVLRAQLAAGKKRLAIFYGAGHMSDMAERLARDFDMQQQHVEWLLAWDLRQPAAAPVPVTP